MTTIDFKSDLAWNMFKLTKIVIFVLPLGGKLNYLTIFCFVFCCKRKAKHVFCLQYSVHAAIKVKKRYYFANAKRLWHAFSLLVAKINFYLQYIFYSQWRYVMVFAVMYISIQRWALATTFETTRQCPEATKNSVVAKCLNITAL